MPKIKAMKKHHICKVKVGDALLATHGGRLHHIETVEPPRGRQRLQEQRRQEQPGPSRESRLPQPGPSSNVHPAQRPQPAGARPRAVVPMTKKQKQKNQPLEPRRPTEDDILKLSDTELVRLIEKNWTRLFIKKSVTERRLYGKGIPEMFNISEPPVQLYQVLKDTDKDGKKDDDDIDGVSGVYLNSGMTGSNSGFQCLDYSIPTVHFLAKGARFWIFIEPEDNYKLEEVVARLGNYKPKSGCLNKQILLFSLEDLRSYGISYKTEIQKVTESILVNSGIYYGWINLLDDTEVIRLPLPDEPWCLYAHEREPFRCSCRQTFVMDWARVSSVQYYSDIDCITVDPVKFGEEIDRIEKLCSEIQNTMDELKLHAGVDSEDEEEEESEEIEEESEDNESG